MKVVIMVSTDALTRHYRMRPELLKEMLSKADLELAIMDPSAAKDIKVIWVNATVVGDTRVLVLISDYADSRRAAMAERVTAAYLKSMQQEIECVYASP